MLVWGRDLLPPPLRASDAIRKQLNKDNGSQKSRIPLGSFRKCEKTLSAAIGTDGKADLGTRARNADCVPPSGAMSHETIPHRTVSWPTRAKMSSGGTSYSSFSGQPNSTSQTGLKYRDFSGNATAGKIKEWLCSVLPRMSARNLHHLTPHLTTCIIVDKLLSVSLPPSPQLQTGETNTLSWQGL